MAEGAVVFLPLPAVGPWLALGSWRAWLRVGEGRAWRRGGAGPVQGRGQGLGQGPGQDLGQPRSGHFYLDKIVTDANDSPFKSGLNNPGYTFI